jgi:hypothetical protein
MVLSDRVKTPVLFDRILRKTKDDDSTNVRWAKVVSTSEEDSLATIDFWQNRIQSERVFEAGKISQDVADDGSVFLLVRTGSNRVNFLSEYSCGGNCYFYLYEAPNITADGSEINAYNHERNSALTTNVKVFDGPTLGSNTGTTLSERFSSGGRGPQSQGGAHIELNVWILKPNTDYVMEAVNVSGGAKDIWLGVVFYENLS